ncbi:MAG: hypothetical protein DRJ62_05575 [Thermoprotei archaeon]|nr:MAG: hypothetical protein DRJ62_05575 [Thermoprotei archaeon]
MMPNIEELVNELGAKDISTVEELKEAYAKTYAFKTVALTGKTHQISMPDEVFSMLQDLTKRLKKVGVKGKINVNDLTMLLVLMGYSKINKILGALG